MNTCNFQKLSRVCDVNLHLVWNVSLFPHLYKFQTLKAMRQFVLQHLQPLNVYCYYADFVQKYTSKLENIPTQPQDGMELIPKIPPEKQSTDQSCDCSNQMKSGESVNNKHEL